MLVQNTVRRCAADPWLTASPWTHEPSASVSSGKSLEAASRLGYSAFTRETMVRFPVERPCYDLLARVETARDARQKGPQAERVIRVCCCKRAYVVLGRRATKTTKPDLSTSRRRQGQGSGRLYAPYSTAPRYDTWANDEILPYSLPAS